MRKGRNVPRGKRTFESRENKQGKRSKSKTSSFMKGVKSGVKRAIKNSPLNVGAMTAANIAAQKKKLQKGSSSGISESVKPKPRPKATSLRPKVRPTKKSAEGGSLKAVPEGNKGLKKLPTAIRNKMGYMQKGGSCRGMGKATRGGSYGRMG